jgi:hypothetical protein
VVGLSTASSGAVWSTYRLRLAVPVWPAPLSFGCAFNWLIAWFSLLGLCEFAPLRLDKQELACRFCGRRLAWACAWLWVGVEGIIGWVWCLVEITELKAKLVNQLHRQVFVESSYLILTSWELN